MEMAEFLNVSLPGEVQILQLEQQRVWKLAAPRLLQWFSGVLRDPGPSHLSALSSPASGFWPQTHDLRQLLPCPTSYDHRRLIKAGRRGRSKSLLMKLDLINKVNPISPEFSLADSWIMCLSWTNHHCREMEFLLLLR